MKILVLFVFIILILFVAIIFLLIKIFKLKQLYQISQRDVKQSIKTLQQVRYGQLDSRVTGLFDNEFQDSINRLVETIGDRENMIKEYQLNLSEKNESLEKMILVEKESQQFKEDFIATLTHDLKVPIIAELNTLDFLIEGRFGELNDKQREALHLMKNSNKELIELAELLLETYKVQQSSIVLKKKKTDINSYVSDVVEEMKPIAQNSSQELLYKPLGFELELNIDRFQVKRVLKNLILNALSFSHQYSPVNLELSVNNDFLEIKVTNVGQGISKEDLLLIFNKYYSNVKKIRKMSTGLGLYLSNQIVKAHAGDISVDSIENETTTFTVCLPID